MSLIDRMLAAGFELQNTGGNCTAFVRRHDDEIEELVTMEDDPTAPRELTDKVAVGTNYNCSPTDPTQGSSGMLTNYTFGDVLAALENPSKEYVLLELRLYNGLHMPTQEPIPPAPVTLTNAQIADLADEALSAAARVIQEKLGIESGDYASMFFGDGNAERILRAYIRAELRERGTGRYDR